MREYMLAYEKKPGDYYPVDLRVLLQDDPFFSVPSNRPISLERIDYFTTCYEDEGELKAKISAKDEFSDCASAKRLVILFFDGKMRTLEDGILYELEEDSIDSEAITNFMLNNIQNYDILNRIYTKFMRPGSISCAFERFLEIIHAPKTVNNYDIINAISNISSFTYLERRRLGLFIHRILLNKKVPDHQRESLQNPLRLELNE